jgi:hypothetical protein
MKFQFSIARLLMATAMVALTFGVARMLLDKAISSYAIAVGVFAADFGLLVLVAQKRSDFYRIIRVIDFMLLVISVFATIGIFFDLRFGTPVYALVIAVSIDIVLLLLFVVFCRLIKRAEANESRRDADSGKSPFRQD